MWSAMRRHSSETGSRVRDGLVVLLLAVAEAPSLEAIAPGPIELEGVLQLLELSAQLEVWDLQLDIHRLLCAEERRTPFELELDFIEQEIHLRLPGRLARIGVDGHGLHEPRGAEVADDGSALREVGLQVDLDVVDLAELEAAHGRNHGHVSCEADPDAVRGHATAPECPPRSAPVVEQLRHALVGFQTAFLHGVFGDLAVDPAHNHLHDVASNGCGDLEALLAHLCGQAHVLLALLLE
eukprot:1797798-Pyramimonas_sp.AAC.2